MMRPDVLSRVHEKHDCALAPDVWFGAQRAYSLAVVDQTGASYVSSLLYAGFGVSYLVVTFQPGPAHSSMSIGHCEVN